MGIHRYDYLVTGWKLKQDIFETDLVQHLSEEVPDNIFYPENGSYAVYGKIIERGDYIEGFKLTRVSVSDIGLEMEEYRDLQNQFYDITSETLLDWTEHQTVRMYLLSVLG